MTTTTKKQTKTHTTEWFEFLNRNEAGSAVFFRHFKMIFVAVHFFSIGKFSASFFFRFVFGCCFFWAIDNVLEVPNKKNI